MGENKDQSFERNQFTIHPDTHIGHVVFKVKDLERQIAFYENVVGLQVIQRDETRAALAGKNGTRPLLVLDQSADEYQAPRTTGIFHIAFLVPTREAFATKFFHILRDKKTVDSPIEQEPRFTHFERILPIARFDSASDHGYSEAFYLHDIEGNGIEIYADRPREDWVKYPQGSHPLNFKELAELANFDTDGSLPGGTVVGHVHLRVANIEESVHFYTDVVGFEKQLVFDDCFFISAGGYHHHFGGNVWNGEGNPHPPKNATGLKEVLIVLSHLEALEAVKQQLIKYGYELESSEQTFAVEDPSGNRLVFGIDEN